MVSPFVPPVLELSSKVLAAIALGLPCWLASRAGWTDEIISKRPFAEINIPL